jgi:hypothetical protein
MRARSLRSLRCRFFFTCHKQNAANSSVSLSLSLSLSNHSLSLRSRHLLGPHDGPKWGRRGKSRYREHFAAVFLVPLRQPLREMGGSLDVFVHLDGQQVKGNRRLKR